MITISMDAPYTVASEGYTVSRTFKHLGHKLDEVQITYKDGLKRLAWCFHPLERIIVGENSTPNHLVHGDIKSNLPLDDLRHLIQLKFEEHHKITGGIWHPEQDLSIRELV